MFIVQAAPMRANGQNTGLVFANSQHHKGMYWNVTQFNLQVSSLLDSIDDCLVIWASIQQINSTAVTAGLPEDLRMSVLGQYCPFHSMFFDLAM